MALWNIYCNTENQFVTSDWLTIDIPPNSCPNNASHDVVLESVTPISLLKISPINSTILTTNSTSYVPLINFIYQGLNMNDVNFLFIKIVASIDFGTYDFCFVNVNNFNIVYESTGNANNSPIIITIPYDAFNSLPSDETPFDIKFKTSGGTLTIRNVSQCFAKTL